MRGVLVVARATLVQEIQEFEQLRSRLLFGIALSAWLLVACAAQM